MITKNTLKKKMTLTHLTYVVFLVLIFMSFVLMADLCNKLLNYPWQARRVVRVWEMATLFNYVEKKNVFFEERAITSLGNHKNPNGL